MPRTTRSPSPGTPRSKSDPGARLGLVSAWDFALHLPLHYIDETRLTPIAALRDGVSAVVQATVRSAELMAGRRRQLRVRVTDDAGELELRFFHFYPGWQRQYAPGKLLRIRGEARAGLFGMEMVHPACQVCEADAPLPRGFTPVYPAGAGVGQPWLRRATAAALAHLDVPDPLPEAVRKRMRLPGLGAALALLHAPPAGTNIAALEDRTHPAWTRIKFDELLAQQMAQQCARARRQSRHACPLPLVPGAGALARRLIAALPFELTHDQRCCAAEIAADLARAQPMHRLLQGDVGSGKTVVAALAAAQAIDAGFQCVLMAPTDLLATQHLGKLAGWLEPLGVRVAWLGGSQGRAAKALALTQVAAGEADLIVGTHAVIQDRVRFARLGLAIVDEQHRFGVAQRLSLRAKGLETAGDAREPHLLTMSATPIPRTLAMALYGDLDVSTIASAPPGRTPVRTRVFAASRRDAVIERVRTLVSEGRQVYWVCPLVEEAPERDITGGSPSAELRNVEATCTELRAALGAQGNLVGLVHGRLRATRKAEVMAEFVAARLRLLVATTVIEVGVDVPTASLMVIEHAERFGLSQLHQLRGRVGRGAMAAECLLLFSEPLSDMARARLRALRDSTDGFALAQKDLELRGPGELLGQRQSGLQALRHADLRTDAALLEQAREVAVDLLRDDPAAARMHLERWLGAGTDWLAA